MYPSPPDFPPKRNYYSLVTSDDAAKLARAHLDGVGHKTPQEKALKKVRYSKGPGETNWQKPEIG